VAAARRFAAAVADWLPGETRGRLTLLVSELATNALQHGRTAFTVGLERLDNAIKVEVSDTGPGVPTITAASLDRPGGRGLRIVETLSDSWGVTPRPTGKTVWFVLKAASSV
jgi:anti-sigma regulatory factor (Ser/Thr protein kinase)